MAEIRWIKITTDIFDDEKILLIESMPDADSLIVIWFKLLAFAGKSNNNGVFMLSNRIPYTEEMLSTLFRRPLNTVRLALQTFEQFGMIEYMNGVLTLPNWEKHQNIDGMDKIREQNRNRKRLQRERQRQALPPADCHVTVTGSHATDKEKEKDKEQDKEYIEEKPAKRQRFTPPTLEEVKAYCSERNNGIDPQTFIDYYESNGWMVGKGKMKDWKATVRTWENRRKNDPPKRYGRKEVVPSWMKSSGGDDLDRAERLLQKGDDLDMLMRQLSIGKSADP